MGKLGPGDLAPSTLCGLESLAPGWGHRLDLHRNPCFYAGSPTPTSPRSGIRAERKTGMLTHSRKQVAGAKTQLSDTSAPWQGLDPGTITWASQGQAPGRGAFPHSEEARGLGKTQELPPSPRLGFFQVSSPPRCPGPHLAGRWCSFPPWAPRGLTGAPGVEWERQAQALNPSPVPGSRPHRAPLL